MDCAFESNKYVSHSIHAISLLVTGLMPNLTTKELCAIYGKLQFLSTYHIKYYFANCTLHRHSSFTLYNK